MNKLYCNDIEISRDGDLSIYEFDFLDNNGNTHLKLKSSETKIAELKEKLFDSDYKALKFAEGELTAEMYEPIKQQRKSWREEIRRLEGEIENGNN